MSAKIGFRYHQTIGLLAQSGRGSACSVDFAFGQGGVICRQPWHPVARNTHVTICTVDGDYRADFGTYGTGDGQFIWPTAAAVDRDGCVYVSSERTSNSEVQPHGQFLGKWGTLGDGDGELNGPSAMVFDQEDQLYVVDHHNNRVKNSRKMGSFC